MLQVHTVLGLVRLNIHDQKKALIVQNLNQGPEYVVLLLQDCIEPLNAFPLQHIYLNCNKYISVALNTVYRYVCNWSVLAMSLYTNTDNINTK